MGSELCISDSDSGVHASQVGLVFSGYLETDGACCGSDPVLVRHAVEWVVFFHERIVFSFAAQKKFDVG